MESPQQSPHLRKLEKAPSRWSQSQAHVVQDWRQTSSDQFIRSLCFMELIVLVFFIGWGSYGEGADPKAVGEAASPDMYAQFQDIHIMIFVGFGFLMMFLRRYGYSAVGFNFLLSCFAIQWASVVRAVVHSVWKGAALNISMDLSTLINGDFAAGSLMISYGAVIGKLSIVELLWMSCFHIIVYAVNESILVEELQISDVGGSLVIHAFGAFFGLAVSWARTPRDVEMDGNSKDNAPTVDSDKFSMIGCMFLWCFWPSFNGVFAGSQGNGSQRAVVNTVLSLTGSCISTFMCSRRFRGNSRFDMVDIQNATLAGGVAVGSLANLAIQPWGALVVGLLAGVVSQLGFCYVQDWVWSRLSLHDTCGVLHLHGIPGLLSGVIAAVLAVAIGDAAYGPNLEAVYAGRAEHSASQQAQSQAIAVVVTLLTSIPSGVAVGWGLSKFFRAPPSLYLDSMEWTVPVNPWLLSDGSDSLPIPDHWRAAATNDAYEHDNPMLHQPMNPDGSPKNSPITRVNNVAHLFTDPENQGVAPARSQLAMQASATPASSLATQSSSLGGEPRPAQL